MRPTLEKELVQTLAEGGRILVTRIQYLGDVILSLPMVDALRRRFPRAEIDYLARADGADILQGEPGFGRIIRLPERNDGQRAMWRAIADLRERRYQVAIDLYSNPRSALLCRLSGARVRIGGARRIRRYLYTHPLNVPASVRSAIDHHLFHLRPLGIEAEGTKPTLHISEAEASDALRTLVEWRVDVDRAVIGIHAGGKWEVKRWPVDYFAELAARLLEADMQVVVFCGSGEEQYRDELRQQLGDRVTYAPTLSLRSIAALIHVLDGMVVCDGGIMHVSAAVDTPTVGIFGSSEPDVWFPYEAYGPFVPAYVPIPCRPCHSHFCSHISCLYKLSADMVEQKLKHVLRESAASRPAAQR